MPVAACSGSVPQRASNRGQCCVRQSYGKPSFEPVGSLDNIEPGSFYLQRVTDKHHRVYATA